MPDKKYVTNFMLQGSNQVWVRDEEAVTQISALDTKIDGVMNRTVKVYDTFASIPTTGLTAGDIVQTKGYYAINDGGASAYRVFAKSTNYFPSNAGYALTVLGEVTAKKCGAKGDGTSDDFSVLQAMFNMYNEIHLQGYTYLVGDTIVGKSSLKLIGNHSTFKRKDDIGKPVLSLLNLTNVTIENVDFIGGTQSSTSYLISSQGCTNITIRGCNFSNSYGYCVRFNNHNNGRIEDCKFSNVTGASGNPGGGVYAQGGNDLLFENLLGTGLMDHLVYIDGATKAQDIIVHGCICRDGLIDQSITAAAGVVAYGEVYNLSITNCAFYNIRTGISVAPRNDNAVKGLAISNCTFRDIDEDGIFIQGIRSMSMSASINNCTLVRCGQDGIGIRDTGGDITIAGVVINNTTRYGIELSNTAHIVITGCTFTSNTQAAIIVGNTAPASSTCIVGCMLSTGNGCDYGIYIRTGSSLVLSSSNIFAGTFTNGSYVCTASSCVAVNMPIGMQNGRSIFWSNAAPSAGTYTAGDIVLDSRGTTNGWKCTASGSPGTWVAR